MSWNESNTFSKLIYSYLKEELGYPERKNQFFDEQTYVRKRGKKTRRNRTADFLNVVFWLRRESGFFFRVLIYLP